MLAELIAATGEAGSDSPLVQEQLFKRLGKPNEIAATIAFLLSEESSFITSSVFEVAGGFGQ